MIFNNKLSKTVYFITILLLLFIGTVLASVNTSCKEGAVVTLWAEAPKNPFANNHPCGHVVYKCITSMPLSTSVVTQSKVFEISKNNQVVRNWTVGADVVVFGIKQDYLIFSDSSSVNPANDPVTKTFISVDLSGKVASHPSVKSNAGPGFDCPLVKSKPDLEDYYCLRFNDLLTKEKRILAIPFVCS